MKKAIVGCDVVNLQGILFAAKGEAVNQQRLEDLLSRGAISFKEYVECNPTATDADMAKAFISYSIGKTIPFAPDPIKHEVIEILEQVSTENNVTKMIGCLERRSLWSYEHSMRVAIIAAAIGKNMKFSSDELIVAAEGSVVHDVGKIFFVNLVEKNSALTQEEYKIIKEHTKAGYRFLKGSGFKEEIAEIALLHHERRNGSGYWGISDLPRSVESVGIADSIDAMMAARPYKSGIEINKVIGQLTEEYRINNSYDPNMLIEARKLMLLP